MKNLWKKLKIATFIVCGALVYSSFVTYTMYPTKVMRLVGILSYSIGVIGLLSLHILGMSCKISTEE